MIAPQCTIYPEFHSPLRMPGLGSTGYTEPARPQYATLRSRWYCGRIWDDICRDARSACYAQAAIKCWYESKDGDNHGVVSDHLGILRFTDYIAPGSDLERHRRVG